VTAEASFESNTGHGDAAGRGKRAWRPMTLEYVNDVGSLMKATHKTGQKGEGDVFTTKRAD
jgi:hypothetical protein